MPSAIPEKTLLKVKKRLKRILLDSEKEIMREIDDEDTWGFAFKHGSWLIHARHLKSQKYMIVAFIIELPDDIIEKIAEMNPKNRSQFEFSFYSAAVSPLTGVSLDLTDDSDIQGFSVTRRFFPFHEKLLYSTFQNIVQSVVSAGFLGLMVIGYLFGTPTIEHEITESKQTTPPESLFA